MSGRIVGQLIAEHTDEGVPGLLIAVVAVSSVVAGARGPVERRIGTVTSGADGRFSLAYEQTEDPELDLELRVLAGGSGEVLVSERREGAGRIESFVIRVPAERLRTHTATVPGSDRRIERNKKRREVRLAERMAAEKLSLEDRANRFQARLESVDRGRAGESRIREALRKSLRDRDDLPFDAMVVGEDDSFAEREVANILDSKAALAERRRATRIGISSAQRATIVTENGSLAGALKPQQVETLFRPFLPDVGRLRLPLGWRCRPAPPADPCLKALEDNEEGGDDQGGGDQPGGDEPGDGEPAGEFDVEPLTDEDTRVMAHRLMAGLLYDADDPIGVPPRASMKEIEASVDGFAIHTGPADVPAYFDFHSVEMAFESLWQELFDEAAVEQATDLYGRVVELGANPNVMFKPSGALKLPAKKFIQPLKPFPQGNQSPPQQGNGYPAPPPAVLRVFELTAREWAELGSDNLADEVESLADIAINGLPDDELLAFWTVSPGFGVAADQNERHEARKQGERIIEYIRRKLAAPDDFDHFHANLEALGKRLAEPYRFTVFAARRGRRSVNFGLLTTYRQRWTPISYQVGELVRTVPMAPGEERRFTKKVTVGSKRAQDLSTSTLADQTSSRQETARASASIVEKASTSTNLSTEVEGSVDFAVGSASAKTTTGFKTAGSSNSTKKQFREAVLKSAEQYKRERKVEVSMEDTSESVFEESGVLKNPNEEITVTYLFYELQRRFRLEEKVHRVQPVVFVAQEFPAPHEIDEDWILTHDWILKRVILDESFLPAMDMLRERIVGDEHALQVLFENVEQHREIVEATKARLESLERQVENRYAALQKAVSRRADVVEAEENDGMFLDVSQFLFGDITSSTEKMEILEGMARDAYQRAAKQEREVRGRLQQESTALGEASRDYSNALSDHLNRKLQISRLRVHIKENIMHYMQAIWMAEPPDQRYLRLHRTPVPRLVGELSYTLEEVEDGVPMPPEWTKPVELSATVELGDNIEYQPLAEVADIDRLLGFRGNYMIFPLVEGNALTDYMALPYQDPVTGLHDPDPLDTWTLDEFSRYVCCLRKELTEEKFLELRPGLQEAYQYILERTASEDDEVIIPTGSLYIEALPGSHPLLEDFKLLHRGIDVQKAFAEVRGAELENVRLAARLVNEEREDPNVDRKIVIDSDASVLVTDDP